mgnify:CR=1 FL=1
MKKIYEKLKPEIQDSIQEDLEKFPASTRILVNFLELHSFWSELTVDEVRTIINHSHLSFVEISMNDILWGDKFLLNEGN